MSSKRKDELKFKISPTLFENEQGEPLCFYLRPGPVKRELMPLIKASGGLLCNVQKPGAILLKDPEEKASITETTAHWYVSTKYIHDCVEKNERLNIEDYRLNPESTNATKRKPTSKVGSPGISGGRTAYTPEEDDAILRYVSKQVKDIGGNRLWQEMAKKQVTCHSWQSMKYRYRVQLAHRLSEYKQGDAERENMKQNTEQSEAENENEETASPERIQVEPEDPDSSSPEMDLTQIPLPSTSQHEQTDVPQAESNDNERCELMETSKSEIDETPEQQQPAQPPPDIASSENDDQPEATTEAKSALNLEQHSVNRPITRQQFELQNMPYVKRLRSSGTPPESLYKSPHKQTSRTKSCPSPKSDPKEAQTPPRKVRRTTGANVAEETEEDTEQSGPSEKSQTDEVNCPAPPQPTEKKAEKRKLGILEMATKEFEDDSESESDGQYETPGTCPSIELAIAASSNSDPPTLPPENQKNPGPLQSGYPPPTNITTTAATTTASPAPDTAIAAAPPVTSGPAVPEPTTRGEPPVEEVTSKAHLFIFQSESQELEEDSQPLVAGPGTSAAGDINGNQQAKTPSLTQDQLEEDVQLLKAFMKETNQDLVSVAKAILKASGDLILARELLSNPSSFSGPIWTRTEDQRLCSGDPTVRQELLTKYGEEGVAKRLMFLELES